MVRQHTMVRQHHRPLLEQKTDDIGAPAPLSGAPAPSTGARAPFTEGFYKEIEDSGAPAPEVWCARTFAWCARTYFGAPTPCVPEKKFRSLNPFSLLV